MSPKYIYIFLNIIRLEFIYIIYIYIYTTPREPRGIEMGPSFFGLKGRPSVERDV